MGLLSKRLQTLGIKLPTPREPAFSYSAVVIDNGLAWVSGQLPWLGNSDSLVHSGRLGEKVNVTEGKSCARACILNGLAVLEEASGDLDRVERIVKLVGYVASATDFQQQPKVIDAASNLLVEIFGDAGAHARSAVGVTQLPRGAPVEIELVVRLRY